MNINLKNTPFSCYGSWLTFRKNNDEVLLCTVSAKAKHGREMLRIELTNNGKSIPFTEELRGESLSLQSDVGKVDVCFEDEAIVRFSGEGVGFRLTNLPGQDAYHCLYGRFQEPGKSALLNLTRYDGRVAMLTALQGRLLLDAPWVGDMLPIIGSPHVILDCVPENDLIRTELVLELNELPQWTPCAYKKSFEEAVSKPRNGLTEWKTHIPEVSEKYKPAAELAGYLVWTSVVNPQGILKRPVSLSGLLGFQNIWGWDNLFEGIALNHFRPELGWNNLVVRFDAQSKSGAVPQTMNDVDSNHNAPPRPLEGWAMQMMRKHKAFSHEQLASFYPQLELNTEWWFRCRSKDGLICHYWHGNDSGADNATSFDATPWIEAPDLNAYLVLQCDALAWMASELGNVEASKRWQEKGEQLLEVLIAEFWNGEQFMVRRVDNGQMLPTTSLLAYLPIILGERLPKEITRKMAEDLATPGAFLSNAGVTSEDMRSPLFRCNGYWRGPVWPSWTMLVVDGLTRAGETDLAHDIAHRYCTNCLQHGFNENYHPLTGVGNGCDSVMWGPSVFLILASEYLPKNN